MMHPRGESVVRLGFLRRAASTVAVLTTCCGVLADGVAAAAGPASGVVTAWGVAQRIPGVNTIVNVPPDASATAVTSVSCATPGDCAAGALRSSLAVAADEVGVGGQRRAS